MPYTENISISTLNRVSGNTSNQQLSFSNITKSSNLSVLTGTVTQPPVGSMVSIKELLYNEYSGTMQSDALGYDSFGTYSSSSNFGKHCASYDGKTVISPTISELFVMYKDTSWTQQARLTIPYSDPSTSGYPSFVGSIYGYPYCSGDGNVVVYIASGGVLSVSGFGETIYNVWIATRNNGTWTQKLLTSITQSINATNTGVVGGVSGVTISGDGNTVAIVTYSTLPNTSGDIIFYSRASRTDDFSLVTRLTPTGYIGDPNLSAFGASLKLDHNGTTFVVGGPADNSYVGAIWVFVKSGNTWVQQGSKIIPTGNNIAFGSPSHGYSVTLSMDGNTMIASSSEPIDVNYFQAGCMYVFTRSGSTWTQQQRIVPPAPSSNMNICYMYPSSLSPDGNVLAISYTGGLVPRTYVYTRSGNTFTQVGTINEPSAPPLYKGTSNYSQFGATVTAANSSAGFLIIGAPYDRNQAGTIFEYNGSGASWSIANSFYPTQVRQNTFDGSRDYDACALSADGNTLVIGLGSEYDQSGYAWANVLGSVLVYSYSGNTWTRQAKIIPPDYTYQTSRAIGFGRATAISGDANTIAFAGPEDTYGTGAIWVYKKSGSSWVQQGSKIVPSDKIGYPEIGTWVSLSYDGNTMAFSSIWEGNSQNGACWIYTRSGSTWSEQAKITVPVLPGYLRYGFGRFPKLSGDGNTLVSTMSDSTTNTSIWIFTRSGTTWSQQAGPLTCSGISANGSSGEIAISYDGNTIAVGNPNDPVPTSAVGQKGGSVSIFKRSGTTWSEVAKIYDPTNTLYALGNNLGMSYDGRTVYVAANYLKKIISYNQVGNTNTWVKKNSGDLIANVFVDGVYRTDTTAAAVSVSGNGKRVFAGGPMSIVYK